MNNNVDFTLDEIHDINLKTTAVRTSKVCPMGLQHQVDQSPMDSIYVPSLSGNAPVAHANHNVVYLLEALGGGNGSFLSNQRSKQLLIIFNSILMHPATR